MELMTTFTKIARKLKSYTIIFLAFNRINMVSCLYNNYYDRSIIPGLLHCCYHKQLWIRLFFQGVVTIQALCIFYKLVISHRRVVVIATVEPLIKDPPRKGHCMLDLSIRDTVWGPKNYHSLYFLFIKNLREEDNLSIRDKTAEFILSPKCPLFGGSTVSCMTPI